ncbi:MAG: hypothetical protein GTO63_27355 [Anaerolineae bacterium]|nr:hypothetical protein [Anaerolineae bacterium]NIN98445.1 hypothetical protein [Anaerolineae bacterium]
MPFTSAPWSSPESNLSPEAFCAVSLIDENPKGIAKAKGMCKLPVRSTPGGPYNVNAMRAASQSLLGARAPLKAKPESKRSAARKLLRLIAEAGLTERFATIVAGLRRLAGRR